MELQVGMGLQVGVKLQVGIGLQVGVAMRVQVDTVQMSLWFQTGHSFRSSQVDKEFWLGIVHILEPVALDSFNSIQSQDLRVTGSGWMVEPLAPSQAGPG